MSDDTRLDGVPGVNGSSGGTVHDLIDTGAAGAEPFVAVDPFDREVERRLADLKIDAEVARRWCEYRAEEFEKVVRGEVDNSAALARFRALRPNEIRGNPILPDMIEGLLGYRGSLNEFTGAFGSMKSLGLLSVCGAIATGQTDLWGFPVHVHGPVVLVYREGQQGFTRRLLAWEDYYGPMGDLVVIYDPMDMRRPEDVRDLAARVQAEGALAVALDPVARTGGGKEDAEDFGEYRRGIENLRDATGASVIVNHNAGVTAPGRGRGHTTLPDGMDSIISFVRKPSREGGGIALDSSKNRDQDALAGTRLTFHPCGPLNPKTGKPWSGVPLVQSGEQTSATALRALDEEVRPILDALDAAGGAGLTGDEMARVIGCSSSNLAKNKTFKMMVDAKLIVDNGQRTTRKRWLRTPGGQMHPALLPRQP